MLALGGLWNKTDTATLNITALTMLKVWGSVGSSFWLESLAAFKLRATAIAKTLDTDRS